MSPPGTSGGGPRHRDRPTSSNAATAKQQVRVDGATPLAMPKRRHDTLDQALADAARRQRARLVTQLERSAQLRHKAGDHEGFALATAWAAEARAS